MIISNQATPILNITASNTLRNGILSKNGPDTTNINVQE